MSDEQKQERYISTLAVQRDVEMPDNAIRVIASAQTKDRYGTIIKTNGLQTNHFEKNPVIFFNHNSRSFPIGRATRLVKDVENGLLIVDIEFDMDDELAKEVLRKVKAGFLNGVSIGFIPNRDDMERLEDGTIVFNSADLLEVSIVGVQGNGDTVVIGRDFTPEQAKKEFEQLNEAIEQRGGRVLSKTNEKHLRNAYQAIGKVLEQLDYDDEDKEEKSAPEPSKTSEGVESITIEIDGSRFLSSPEVAKRLHEIIEKELAIDTREEPVHSSEQDEPEDEDLTVDETDTPETRSGEDEPDVETQDSDGLNMEKLFYELDTQDFVKLDITSLFEEI